MKKSISVVTVTYNSSKTINKLLKSLVLNKDYLESVNIIENDSPEAITTENLCKKFINKLNLNYNHRDNDGFGISSNFGANNSKGKYILFLNPDTELKIDSLKILLEHLEKNKAQIAGGKAFSYDKVAHGSAVRIPTLYTGLFEFSNLGKLFNNTDAHRKFYYEDTRILTRKVDTIVDAVSGAYLLITRSAFKKLKGFDENIFMYLEDVDLCKRAIDLGMKTIFCPHSNIWHIGGASSKNKYKISHQAWFDARKYYYKKHFNIFANTIIQPLFTVEEYLLKKIKSL